VGEGAQQHDHLPARHAGVGQLAQACSDGTGLGQAVEGRAAVDRRFELDSLLVPAVARGQQ
jgi:hypothetical protein